MQGRAMAKDGLIALLCAFALGAPHLLSPAQAAPGDDRDSMIATTLVVQTAMQQARDFLLRNDSKSAVQVLEAQLARINGNAAYLTLLRDAYRARIKELRLAGQEAEAQRYLERLQVLDPGAALDGSFVRGANAPAQPAPQAPAKPTAAAPPKTDATARGKMEEEEDPFRPAREDKQGKGRSLLARAESEFSNRRYKEAGQLFEQAHQVDANVVAGCLDRWAYCKLFRVVEQLNQTGASPSWSDLEQETRQALAMAPKLDYAQQLLAEIDKRKTAKTAKEPTVAVQHYEADANGWARAETANFRVFHAQPREVAEQAAQIAERTRTTIAAKWFGGFKDDWSPRCDIYLYATAQEYRHATQAPADSPGHSTFRSDAGRIISRRIDLPCDDVNNMLVAVLPHEATHAVLAGQFGDQRIPPWADEGMAVLTEPRDRIERHLRNLPRCRREDQLFSVKDLMTMTNYPDPRYITAFYAESVSLVEYLSAEKGPQEFSLFLREAIRNGYEASLQKHYGHRSFDELQQKWVQKAFNAETAQGGH
jgi:tetratricopeptide (TPR) repeat protein